MYINNIHILAYFFIGLLGLVVGQFMSWANIRLEKHQKVICKELFKEYIPYMKLNMKLMYSTALIYIVLLYFHGFSLQFLEFLILTPMLISAFVIDYKAQIIPNRLSLSIFEVGFAFTFISGLSGITVFYENILGMLIGGGIFLLITLIGGLIAGKEAMGYGDVKLMGALGLIFGLSNIISITVMSFLIGAILSIVLLATKIRKMDQYIAFGPFIVIATFIAIFVPYETILMILLNIFTLGLYSRNK